MTDVVRRAVFSPVHLGIILLTLVTAVIHTMLATRVPGTGGLLFLLDAVVYVLLLVGMFAPIPALAGRRPLVRLLLIVWTVATIVAWAISGKGRNAVGYTDKLVELALVALLMLDAARARSSG